MVRIGCTQFGDYQLKRRLPTTTRLRDVTIALYNQRLSPDMNRDDIARATGLSRTWLLYFGRGTLTTPSVNNVECLYEFLTGRSIEL